MIRAKITAYIPQDLADTLRRVAAVRDRSVSDIVEEAIAKAFANSGREAEQAALMAKLDTIARKLGVLEKGQETHFELSAHAARFVMSVTPEVGEPEKVTFNARGAERFRNVIDAIVQRLAKGRSVWRDNFAGDPLSPQPGQSVRAAE
ncbi:MAG: ribbon-helix-helix protein, CopG family [Hyphomonadaceae bacterium]|nr:ribbon-helix-helix protein, CopG family [Hyphomonadaceae bacterium]